MVHILIAPGFTPDNKPMRSIEYDTVSDRCNRFLREKVLPEVEKSYKPRPDGYSRGIGGESSGGIRSFNSAGSHPINSAPFIPPLAVMRPFRWMSDGADDLENNHGSWPLQNIEMANSVKFREYDFHFRFGQATHDSAQSAIDLPESLAWLPPVAC